MRDETPASKHTNHDTAVFSFIKILLAIYCDIHKEGNRISNEECVFVIWRYE